MLCEVTNHSKCFQLFHCPKFRTYSHIQNSMEFHASQNNSFANIYLAKCFASMYNVGFSSVDMYSNGAPPIATPLKLGNELEDPKKFCDPHNSTDLSSFENRNNRIDANLCLLMVHMISRYLALSPPVRELFKLQVFCFAL